MKKVLFTATVDSHILQFHLPFLKLFKEKGYEVHVATNGIEEIPFCDVKHTVSFERSPYKLNNLRAIKQLKKICLEEKFDIIHCHTPMGAVVTRLAAKKARKKYHTRVIYTAHGFHFYKGASIKNWMLFYPVEKYLAKFTDTLITINQEDYELAKKKFSKRCFDIQYVPGVGIDEEKFNFKMTEKEKQELRKSIGLKKDDFVMIYPAELSNRKRQIWLINTLTDLFKKNSKMHLLLPGKDSLNGKCQKLVQDLDLENQIHFLGYRKDIPKLIKISDVAVSSANQEGLPVNIMEAMYIGLPIVASNCRGNRDLVEDGKNGYLVDLEDSQRFANCVNNLFQNKPEDFGFRSNKKIMNYLIDIIINEMDKIYFRKKTVVYIRSNSIVNDSRCTKEIKSLSSRFKYNVLVMCWDRESLLKNDKSFFENQDISYYIYNKKSKYGSGIKNIFKILFFNIWLYRSLKRCRAEIDSVHSCDLDTGFVTRFFCKKYGINYIYDIFDYYSHSHNCGFLKDRISKMENSVINDAKAVIICNEWRKKQIKNAKPKELFVIHNSPDLNFEESKKYKINRNGKTKICYVGILQDDRLLMEILDVIKKTPSVELHIGGFGKYADAFLDASFKYDNIYYYGGLDYKSVLSLERECDILFATYNPAIINHTFSAPNKLYEAMGLGKPIIVCKNTGVDSFVKEKKLGYVIDYNAEEFISVVKKISKSELKYFNNYSKKIYNNHYRWNDMFDLLKDIY